MSNKLILNCSYRTLGKTNKLARAIKEQHSAWNDADILMLPNFLACHNCEAKNCQSDMKMCFIRDSRRFVAFYEILQSYDEIMFVTPVYLNMPTPKLIAFLSRMSTHNDINGRNLFEGKTAYISIIADVSGTQQVASILMNSLNMLGFGFRGKCVLEHINEWKTGKIRGGFLREDIAYMEEKNDE